MKQTELFDFQKEGVLLIRDSGGRVILADDLGLGKTIQSLSYAHRFLPDDPPGPVVIVVPAHLRLNWRSEASRHLGIRVEILYGETRPVHKAPPHNRNQVYVLSYDSLSPEDWRPQTPPPEDSWIPFLAGLKPRLLIADEGHYLKNPRSSRSRAFNWLARRTPQVIILTGTPMANKPADLWALLHMLHPEDFPSQFDFCTTYSFAHRVRGKWVYQGARNLEQLHERLRGRYMIRRRKEDVLDQLPAITHSVVPIECDLREYRKAESDYLGWLEEGSPADARRQARALEVSRLNGLRRLAGQVKVDGVIRWVESFLEDSDRKLLLGALHYAVTEPLIEHFGHSATLVDGRVSGAEKQARFDRFNLDPRCRLLIGNIDAAGTGWSCKSTSDVAVIEMPWRPSDLTQFCGRVHGIERGLPGTAAHIRYLIAEDTVEADICEALQRKSRWAAAAIDGDRDVADVVVHDMVREMIRSRQKKKS